MSTPENECTPSHCEELLDSTAVLTEEVQKPNRRGYVNRTNAKWHEHEVKQLLLLACNDNIRLQLSQVTSSIKKHKIYRELKYSMDQCGMVFPLSSIILKFKKLRLKYKIEKEKTHPDYKGKKRKKPWKFLELMDRFYDNVPLSDVAPLQPGIFNLSASDLDTSAASTTVVNVSASQYAEEGGSESHEVKDQRFERQFDQSDESIFHKIVIMTKDGQTVECDRIELQDAVNELNNDVAMKTSGQKDQESSKEDEEELMKQVDKGSLADDSDFLYLRSILPDMKKLSDRTKGVFKIKVQQLLHELLYLNETQIHADHEY